MYDLDKIWKGVVEYLKLPLNAEISTDGIFRAIQNTTSFCRLKTIKNIIVNLENRGFIKRTQNIGIWSICKLSDNKKDNWLEVG